MALITLHVTPPPSVNDEEEQVTEPKPDSPPARKRDVDIQFSYHLFRSAGLVRKVQIREEKMDFLVEMEDEYGRDKALSLFNQCQIACWEKKLTVTKTNRVMVPADGEIFDKSAECDEEVAAAAAKN